MKLRWKIAQWFELRWWRNYLNNKEKTEYLEWKRNYWKGILHQIANQVKIKSSDTILDLGCGPAGIFIALPENKVTAVDPLLAEYEKHIGFFRQKDYPNTVFFNSTIEEFSAFGQGSQTSEVDPVHGGTEVWLLAQEKFDWVFCMNAINHVRDIEKGFDMLRELCTENGAIIISIDAHNFAGFKYLFRLMPGDVLHPHQYNLEEYKKMLAKEGWKVKDTLLLKKGFFFDHCLMVAGKRGNTL